MVQEGTMAASMGIAKAESFERESRSTVRFSIIARLAVSDLMWKITEPDVMRDDRMTGMHLPSSPDSTVRG
jgi:hypothetical protein